MKANKYEWVYTASRKSCGHIVAASVDVPGDEKETAKFLADQVKRGHVIARVQGTVQGPWCGSHCPESPHYPAQKSLL